MSVDFSKLGHCPSFNFLRVRPRYSGYSGDNSQTHVVESVCTTIFFLAYLKQSTSSNGSPFSIICIRPPFPYLEHPITLLLPTFTFNFLLSHTLPSSLTSLHNFSCESATSAVSSANTSGLISNLPPFSLSHSSSFQSFLVFTYRTTPSIHVH